MQPLCKWDSEDSVDLLLIVAPIVSEVLDFLMHYLVEEDSWLLYLNCVIAVVRLL